MTKYKIWRLRSKEERRFKQGHPWVYSNELQESPKGIEPGDVIELCDAGGAFLAYGFGNPNSLIAFRTLTREKTELEIPSEAFFTSVISNAYAFRLRWFSPEQSFRVVFGEVDGLPGLVIDRFVGATSVAWVVQPHSFGMDRNLEFILKALATVSGTTAKNTSSPATKKEQLVILRRDASSREREGLTKLTTEVRSLARNEVMADTTAFKEFSFAVPGLSPEQNVELTSDLISGQKTGFFFDQLQNIGVTQNLIARKLRQSPLANGGEIKILDLCSYIGQWSVHLTELLLKQSKQNIEVTCVDASENALHFADRNVNHQAERQKSAARVKMKRLKADVLEPMPTLAESYAVVIADPPAFIKNRKSIPQGKAAYVNLMTTAIQKTAPQGLVVCCSCSQLLSEEEFQDALAKATRRSGKRVRWISESSPSLDHFARFEFPEGHYLKCWIGEVD
jgi:23S rRNA (cytosine1962-C5)-methyltransferase